MPSSGVQSLKGQYGERREGARGGRVSYPLILRSADNAWWKLASGTGLMIFGFVIVVPVVLMPVLALSVMLQGGPGSFGDRFAASMRADQVTPSSMLYVNLTLASLTVLAMLTMRFVHGLSPRWLASVLPGMRWKFFFACLGLAAIAVTFSLAVQAMLPGETVGTAGQASFPTGQLLATAIVILLTTPLQALGEEYGFRGYLMQVFGSLFCSRVTAVVLTSALFALAHGVQNLPLFFDRFAFGLMAGLAVVLIGGLEAGIALHVLNNIVAFGLAIAYDSLGSALNVTEVTWWQIPQTIVQNGVYLLLVLWAARRLGLANRASSMQSDRS